MKEPTAGNVVKNTHVPKKGATPTVVQQTLSERDFASEVSSLGASWIEFKLKDGERHYLAGDALAAAEQYRDLIALDEFGALGASELVSVAEARLEMIGLGLNYFGYWPRYAPLLDRRVLATRAEALLNVAMRTQGLLLQVDQAKDLQAILLELRETSIQTANAGIEEHQREIDSNELERQRAETEIDSGEAHMEWLQSEIAGLWDMHDRLVTLEDGTKLDFFKALGGMSSVYFGGKDLWTSFQSSGDPFSIKFLKDNKTLLKELGGGLGDVADSGLIDWLAGSKEPVYDEIDLLPIKTEIRTLTHRMFEVSQRVAAAKFQVMICESDTRHRYMALRRLESVREKVNSRLNARHADGVDWGRARAGIQESLEQVIMGARRYVFFLARAQQLWDHREHELALDFSSTLPSVLRAQFELVRSAELDAYEASRLRWQKDLVPRTITITRGDDPVAFSLLEQTGECPLAIQRSMLRTPNEYNHRLLRLDIDLFDAAVEDTIAVRLKHGGTATFHMPDGEKHEYRHPTFALYMKYDVTNETRINVPLDEERMAMLSPLGLWTLKLDSGVDATRLTAIRLSLSLAYEA